MTTPTGQIAFSDLNVEMGRAWNAPLDLNWVRSQTHVGGEGGQVMAGANLAAMRGLTYFKRNYTAPSDRAYLQTGNYTDRKQGFVFSAGSVNFFGYNVGFYRGKCGTVHADTWLDGRQVFAVKTTSGVSTIEMTGDYNIAANGIWINGTIYWFNNGGHGAGIGWKEYPFGGFQVGGYYDVFLV